MFKTLPANVEELGAHAYLFKSPQAGCIDFMVIAHGGSIDKTQRFDVPIGATIKFFANAGSKLGARTGPLGFIRDKISTQSTQIYPENTFAAGRACPDYILAKAFEGHWEDRANQASYVGLRSELDSLGAPGAGLNWLPNIVTVRHRTALWRDKNVWLSALVADIVKLAPACTIYCANCRDDDSARAKKLRKTVGASALGSATGR